VKQIVAVGLAALALMLMTHQQASAWHKCSFGVGMNLACEGGGNSVLWGMAKGAPSPGQMDGGFPDGYGYGPGAPAFGGNFAPIDPGLAANPAPAPARVMPQAAPPTTQPVGYFPYADPAVGYYPYAYAYPSWYYGYQGYRR
jgi:hypothetical protein